MNSVQLKILRRMAFESGVTVTRVMTMERGSRAITSRHINTLVAQGMAYPVVDDLDKMAPGQRYKATVDGKVAMLSRAAKECITHWVYEENAFIDMTIIGSGPISSPSQRRVVQKALATGMERWGLVSQFVRKGRQFAKLTEEGEKVAFLLREEAS